MSELEAIYQGFLQGSFSVAVAAFLLIRTEKELRHLREAIDNLRLSVGKLSEQHNSLSSLVACLCQSCWFSPLNTGQEKAD